MSVTKIEINGSLVGIIGLDACFEEVRSLGITDRESLKELLLNNVKENNYIPASVEKAYGEALLNEYRIFTGEIEREAPSGGPDRVRLYGSSCFRCEKLDEMVKDILSKADIKADYLHITDIRETARDGIITTPALTVNGRTILAGQVPSQKDLEKIMRTSLKARKKA